MKKEISSSSKNKFKKGIYKNIKNKKKKRKTVPTTVGVSVWK